MVRKRKPNWWLLYLTVPLMLGLLVIESQMPYPLVVHRVAELAIVALGFGLMLLWVRGNEAGLMNEEIQKDQWTVRPHAAEGIMKPALPPSADECDDSDGHHRPEPSPTKGRYN